MTLAVFEWHLKVNGTSRPHENTLITGEPTSM